MTNWETGIYNSSLSSYESTFVEYYPNGLTGFRNSFYEANRRVPFSVNIMGQTKSLRELAVPGISMSIEDTRSTQEISADSNARVVHIVTDLNDVPDSEIRLVSAMQELGVSNIDLFFARAIAGDRGIYPDRNHIADLLTMLSSKLSRGGIFLYHGIPGKIPSRTLVGALNSSTAKTRLRYDLIKRKNEVIGFRIFH